MATMITTYPNVLATEMADDRSRTWTDHQTPKHVRRGTEPRPTSTSPRLPAIPPPTLQKDAYSPTSRPSALTPHDSVYTLSPDQTLLLDNATLPYKASSMSSSSAGNSIAMTPLSSNELEKSSLATKDSDHQRRSSRKSSSHRDPEKGGHEARHSSQRRTRPQIDPTLTISRFPYADIDNDDDDTADDELRQMQEAHAVQILLFLSLPCVVLSMLNAVWTLMSLFITTLTQPVRLCARRPTFGQQLGGLVGPALNLQLRSIYTPLPPFANEDTTYRPASLVAIQLLSPFLSFGMMIAAWVVAVFWLTSMMIGDPAGMDRRDDGRDTVLGLRRWWERWLIRSMSNE